MKSATSPLCTSATIEMGIKVDTYRVNKSRLDAGDAEIAACLLKLKDMVPTIPLDKKISKVQLLQHVIDYIVDLEVTLDTTPIVLCATSQLNLSDRKPLGENTLLNTVHSSNSITLSRLQTDCNL